MKKFLAIIVALFATLSCSRDYDYQVTITYKIYYPGNTVTKTYTADCTDDAVYYLNSDRGTNYLYVDSENSFFSGYGTRLECTSAPIEVIYFNNRKKN